MQNTQRIFKINFGNSIFFYGNNKLVILLKIGFSISYLLWSAVVEGEKKRKLAPMTCKNYITSLKYNIT